MTKNERILAALIVIKVLLLIVCVMHSSVQRGVEKFVRRIIGPMSSGELPLDLDWWKKFQHKTEHNCYDYAFGNVKNRPRERSQPGTVIGGNGVDLSTPYTCPLVAERLARDHTNKIYPATFETQCKPDEYKVALMVDPGISIAAGMASDYHFMRQDDNGLWSHKPGQNDPVNTDGDGQLIYAPHESNRKLGFYNYRDMCGYYCVDRDIHSTFKQ